jgi:hypothetical protein
MIEILLQIGLAGILTGAGLYLIRDWDSTFCIIVGAFIIMHTLEWSEKIANLFLS